MFQTTNREDVVSKTEISDDLSLLKLGKEDVTEDIFLDTNAQSAPILCIGYHGYLSTDWYFAGVISPVARWTGYQWCIFQPAMSDYWRVNV